jgi:hypothetical protein
MRSLYNRVAGQSVERLAALSDGIFAVSMPLLVLDLRVPAAEAVHSEQDLRRAPIVLFWSTEPPFLLTFTFDRHTCQPEDASQSNAVRSKRSLRLLPEVAYQLRLLPCLQQRS